MRPFVEREDGFLYEQIATVISTMVANETLAPGDALPSVREISRSRDVSISTAVKAYRLLEDRGLVEARPKSGFYVREVRRRPIAEPTMTRPPRDDADATCHGLVRRMVGTLSDPNVVRFGAALPSEDHLPTDDLGRHLARVARDSAHQMPAYEPAGDPALRRAFAQRGILSGCAFDVDELLVTNECLEALSLSLQATTSPGDTVGVESPAFFGFFLLLEKLGLRVRELPTSAQTGVCLEEAESALRSGAVDVLLLNPSFTNPIGSLMPQDHRAALYQLLGRYDVPLIEDDIYGDLYFGGARPKPVKALDTKGRVLYCTSISKTVAPGYRVGVVAGGRYHDEIVSLKMAHNASTSLPVQRAIASYLDQPGFEKRLRELRRTYADTLHSMRAHVGDVFPEGTRVSNPQGGFLLWIELPNGIDAMRLWQKAMRENISIAPGLLFSCCEAYDDCIRLNGGLCWNEETRTALGTLGRLVRDLEPAPAGDGAARGQPTSNGAR